jgi:hypothetical protein
MVTVPEDQDAYRRARRRVREIRGFYVHVAVFVTVNFLLHLINFVATPKVYWAFWPLVGWGIGLLARTGRSARSGNSWTRIGTTDELMTVSYGHSTPGAGPRLKPSRPRRGPG